MSRWAKLMVELRTGQNNMAFDDLCSLVKHLGYVERRQTGSHLIFAHRARPELPGLNLQPVHGKAKPYQVRQVLKIIEDYDLEVP